MTRRATMLAVLAVLGACGRCDDAPPPAVDSPGAHVRPPPRTRPCDLLTDAAVRDALGLGATVRLRRIEDTRPPLASCTYRWARADAWSVEARNRRARAARVERDIRDLRGGGEGPGEPVPAPAPTENEVTLLLGNEPPEQTSWDPSSGRLTFPCGAHGAELRITLPGRSAEQARDLARSLSRGIECRSTK